jgi:hypothetical protein
VHEKNIDRVASGGDRAKSNGRADNININAPLRGGSVTEGRGIFKNTVPQPQPQHTVQHTRTTIECPLGFCVSLRARCYLQLES